MSSIGLPLDHFWIRLFIAAMLWTILSILYKFANQNFRGVQGVLFKFTCLSYLITYFIGATAIFVFGEAALAAYFHTLVFPTSHAQNLTVFLLGAIPFSTLAIISFLLNSRVEGRTNATHTQPSYFADRRTTRRVLATAFLVIAPALILLGQDIPKLIINSVSLGDISGLRNLYLARGAALDNFNFVQAGLLYGALPALAAGLMQYDGPKSIFIRLAAIFVTALLIILNLGLFQVAPLFAFLLILSIMKYLGSSHRIFNFRYLLVGGFLFLIYSIYASLKVSGSVNSAGDLLLQIFMRMPVASPYLVDMKQQYAGSVLASDYVPRLLGYHMFPGIRSVGGHISMPQPSFLVTWYHFGVLASLSAFFVALLLPFWLSKALVTGREAPGGFQRAVLTYSLCHYIYYLFQTSHNETIISSYGIIFPLIPYIIFSVLSIVSRSSQK